LGVTEFFWGVSKKKILNLSKF